MNKWFEKRIFMKFFLPALLSSLGLAIGGIADSLYIGNMLSDSGLFVLGAAAPIYMVFSTISIGIAEGGAIHFSALLSEGKEKEACSVFSSVIMIDLLVITVLCILGLVFLAPLVSVLGCTPDMETYGDMISYVRLQLITAPILFMQAPLQFFVHTDNSPKLASAALVIGNICDCAFGFLFICILKVGVIGSICSTVCGAIIMESICISHFFKDDGALKFKRITKPKVKEAAKSFVTGFATATQYLYQFLVLLVFNHLLIDLGGEPFVAVFDITISAGSLVIAINDAVILTIIPLVSTFYGERNRPSMRHSFFLALRIGLVLTIVFAGALFALATPYCEFAGLAPETVPAGAYALRMYMLSLVIASANTIFAAYLQNIGKEKISYIITALRGVVVLLSCGLILSIGGFEAFWTCYLITEGIVAILIIAAISIRKLAHKPVTVDFPNSRVFSETFSGSCALISETCERIQEFVEESGASMKKAMRICLAVDETCRLIADNEDDLMLQLTLVYENNEYSLHIRDNKAHSFNPFDISEDDERGLGLKIIKKDAKAFYYRQFVGYNTLTIVFSGE